MRRALGGGAAAAALLLLALPCTAGATPVPAHQELVVLLGDPHAVHPRPRAGTATVTLVAARRPLTGTPTTLPVLGHATDPRGRRWLRVRLPGRTLGRRPPPATGWIRSAGTRRAATTWHLLVDRAARRATVYRAGRVVRRLPAIVGRPATPTPRGDFFVEENVRLPRDRSGAPFALAASARSSVLQEFDGGPGQIAVHGRGNVGGRLGTAVSHGCVRLGDRDVRWLAARARAGMPITIR